MKAKYIKLNLIVVMLLLFATLITLFGGVGVTYAAETNYSNVLDDLRKDSDFNVADYPAINNDFSLKVIQVAESTDKELFLYVYQPAARAKMLVATSVNMSLSDKMGGIVTDETELTDKDKPKQYNLTFLNGAGVFQKYRVDGVTVSSEVKRYYNVTSIYRAFNNVVDGTNSDNVDEIAFEVAQLWTVETDEQGKITYTATKTEVVTILDEYASFIRYTSGYWYTTGEATDGHYVAFTANYDIERLYEAEVYFVQSYKMHHYANMSGRHSYKTFNSLEKQVKLSDIDKGHVKITGLGGTRHSWERIQRVDDFIKSESSLPAESKDKIKDKQWILRFIETDYTKNINSLDGYSYDEYYYEISNVMILRLYFETNGRVYNLGVVNNKVSEHNPYKDKNGSESLFDKIMRIIKFILNWFSNLLHIPSLLGTVIISTLIIVAILIIVLIVVKIIRNIRGK